MKKAFALLLFLMPSFSQVPITYDARLKEAAKVTRSPCYGHVIQFVVPDPGSADKPAVVIYGQVIYQGQEDEYDIWADRDAVVISRKPTYLMTSDRSNKKVRLVTAPPGFGCQ